MKVIQITPGAGDCFYCENCLRDHAQVRAMRALGTDVMMVPLYLPALDDRSDDPITAVPIFFGGVNVYLQQKLRLFRWTPRWLDRLFDFRPLLRWASRKTDLTKTEQLGETTLSMLRGSDGRQVKELDRLVDFLADESDVDFIHLSTALLAGLAPKIRQRLGCKITCSLQGEDTYLDALGDKYASLCWQELKSRLKDVAGLFTASTYYAQTMASRLNLPAESISVAPNGIETAGYEPAAVPPETPAIGFLSQMSRSKGLDVLIDAFGRLRQSPRFNNLRLRISGGSTAGDQQFLREQRKIITRNGWDDYVDWIEKFDRESKQDLLRSLSVLAVPARHGEAWAQYALEAMASGVPAVLPNHGANIEIVQASRGGLLHEPNRADALAETIASLLDNPTKAAELGSNGRRYVLENFSANKCAATMLDKFQDIAKE